MFNIVLEHYVVSKARQGTGEKKLKKNQCINIREKRFFSVPVFVKGSGHVLYPFLDSRSL